LRIFSRPKVLIGFFAAALLFLALFPGVINRRAEKAVVREWLTPLDTGRREDWDTILVSKKGKYLSPRAAYAHLEEHLHTGIDLQNRHGGGPGEPVYAVAQGKVFDVKIQGAGTRVSIAHLLPDGEMIYSSYIHMAGIRVKKGQRVDSSTVLGRRLNRQELAKYGSYYNHLHFQIHRGKFNAADTIQSKKENAVRKKFYDPFEFLKGFPERKNLSWRDWLKEGRISFWELLWIIF